MKNNDLFYVYVPEDTKHADINDTLSDALEAFIRNFGVRETYLVYIHPDNLPNLITSKFENIKIEAAKFGAKDGVKIFVSKIDQSEGYFSPAGQFVSTWTHT